MGKGSWEEVTWPIHLSKWWEYNSPLLSWPCIHPIHLSRGTRKEILSYGKTWINTLANLIEWLFKLSWSTEGQSLPLTLLSSLSHIHAPVTPIHLRMCGKVIPELLDKQPGSCRPERFRRLFHPFPVPGQQWNKSSGNRGESPGTEDHPTNSWYRLHMVGLS